MVDSRIQNLQELLYGKVHSDNMDKNFQAKCNQLESNGYEVKHNGDVFLNGKPITILIAKHSFFRKNLMFKNTRVNLYKHPNAVFFKNMKNEDIWTTDIIGFMQDIEAEKGNISFPLTYTYYGQVYPITTSSTSTIIKKLTNLKDFGEIYLNSEQISKAYELSESMVLGNEIIKIILIEEMVI
ncbi:MAG: hypothetical protein ACYCS1_04430 [Gammaproteobacteria bacterium]